VEKKGAEGLAVVLSGTLSNEDLFAAKKLFIEELGAGRILVNPEPDQVGEEDNLLRKRYKVPNLQGARAMTFPDSSWDDLRKAIEGGKVWGLYVVDRDPTKVWGDAAAKLASKPELVVFQGTNSNAFTQLAQFSLGAATHGEEDGTFTNFEGQVQRYRKAFEPLAEAMSDWKIFNELLSCLGAKPTFETAEEAFAELAAAEPAFRGLKWDELEPNGKRLSEGRTKAAEAVK
jgi:predicted molibdopterin-dependent oxidoreductase YjgC